MSILPKLIYRFIESPIKILARLFVDTNKIFLEFILKGKGTRIAETIKKKKDKWEWEELFYQKTQKLAHKNILKLFLIKIQNQFI